MKKAEEDVGAGQEGKEEAAEEENCVDKTKKDKVGVEEEEGGGDSVTPERPRGGEAGTTWRTTCF